MQNFFVLAAIVTLTTATSATAECPCDAAAPAPYVHWLPDADRELDETPWRLINLEIGYDLTAPGEPPRCFVELEAIPHEDPVLYEEPFLEVPVGDFEIHFTGSWMLASEVEAVLRDTECFSLM